MQGEQLLPALWRSSREFAVQVSGFDFKSFKLRLWERRLGGGGGAWGVGGEGRMSVEGASKDDVGLFGWSFLNF